MKVRLSLTSSLVLLLNVAPASAAVTVVQQAAPAPTYGITLNFDEPGGPTGPAPLNAWSGTHGITNADSGVGGGVVVDNFNASYPWLPNNLTAYGAFGLFWNFNTDMTSMSFQAWDTSGPPSPFGGGVAVVLLNDNVELAFEFFNPAWGGIGNSWYHITTSGGTVFDEVRVLGFGTFPETFMDNMSWNVVPGPGGLMTLALAGLFGSRRRRA